jgi:hypothetical protein
MSPMAQYWHARYLQTLLKVESARSPQVRCAYLDLAVHYRAMQQLCERPLDHAAIHGGH